MAALASSAARREFSSRERRHLGPTTVAWCSGRRRLMRARSASRALREPARCLAILPGREFWNNGVRLVRTSDSQRASWPERHSRRSLRAAAQGMMHPPQGSHSMWGAVGEGTTPALFEKRARFSDSFERPDPSADNQTANAAPNSATRQSGDLERPVFFAGLTARDSSLRSFPTS